MKIITDQLQNVKLFASESSPFDLSDKINESLTGHKQEVIYI